MRYFAALALFMVSFVYKANAQLTLGARAGYGFSASSLQPTQGVERTYGFSPVAGLIFHYNLDIKFTVGAEVNYNKYAETITYNLDSNTVKSKTEISYIQIPISGRASIGDKKYRAYVELGAYAGIGYAGGWDKGPVVSYFQNKPDVPSGVKLDANIPFGQNKLKKLDVGGVFGGGIEYKLGTTDFVFAGARIQMGLFNFYNITDVERRAFSSNSDFLLPDATWQAVYFSAGYLRTFKLPKISSDSGSKRAGKQKKGA